ncbi:hypothetical protein APX01_18355 [Cereibacter sphaeroides]|nr:hypothetical protein APX01_18355 [Cereibacter sphaeroides]ANS36230.1 hypothetical protein A3858_18360 [Cereibacter sphaeroides]ATN65286.1 hypothetical protein A3857_18380 [Cereibacter sphaeroides]
MLGLDLLPGIQRILAVHAPPGVRIPHHGDAVPDQTAVIHRVAQDAVATLRVAVQRRGIPLRPARGGDPPRVQLARNGPRALPLHIGREDLPDDLGLVRHDLALSRLARDAAIAVGLPAGVATVADHAGETPARLGFQRLEEHRPHEPPQAHRHRIRHALMHCQDVDPGEAQPLVDVRQILLIAAQPVERLHDHDVELAGPRLLHHAREPVATEDARRGLRTVVIGRDDGQPAPRGMLAAERHLIVNRSSVLELRRVAGVDCGAPAVHPDSLSCPSA